MISIPIWLAVLLLIPLVLGFLLFLGWFLVGLGWLMLKFEKFAIRRGWMRDNYPEDC
jgi:hypothetical protein